MNAGQIILSMMPSAPLTPVALGTTPSPASASPESPQKNGLNFVDLLGEVQIVADQAAESQKSDNAETVPEGAGLPVVVSVVIPQNVDMYVAAQLHVAAQLQQDRIPEVGSMPGHEVEQVQNVQTGAVPIQTAAVSAAPVVSPMELAAAAQMVPAATTLSARLPHTENMPEAGLKEPQNTGKTQNVASPAILEQPSVTSTMPGEAPVKFMESAQPAAVQLPTGRLETSGMNQVKPVVPPDPQAAGQLQLPGRSREVGPQPVQIFDTAGNVPPTAVSAQPATISAAPVVAPVHARTKPAASPDAADATRSETNRTQHNRPELSGTVTFEGQAPQTVDRPPMLHPAPAINPGQAIEAAVVQPRPAAMPTSAPQAAKEPPQVRQAEIITMNLKELLIDVVQARGNNPVETGAGNDSFTEVLPQPTGAVSQEPGRMPADTIAMQTDADLKTDREVVKVFTGIKPEKTVPESEAKESAATQPEATQPEAPAPGKGASEPHSRPLQQVLHAAKALTNIDARIENIPAHTEQAAVKDIASIPRDIVTTAQAASGGQDNSLTDSGEQAGGDQSGGRQMLTAQTHGPSKATHQDGVSTPEFNESARKNLPEQVVQQIKERLAQHEVKPGNQQITLTLSPDSLGELKMSLNLQGQKLSVEIVTENRAMRDAIVQHTDALKESLARQNITMESFDVTTGGKGSGSQGQNQNAWRELAKQQQQQQFWAPPRGYQIAQADLSSGQAAYQKQSSGHAMLDIHY